MTIEHRSREPAPARKQVRLGRHLRFSVLVALLIGGLVFGGAGVSEATPASGDATHEIGATSWLGPDGEQPVRVARRRRRRGRRARRRARRRHQRRRSRKKRTKRNKRKHQRKPKAAPATPKVPERPAGGSDFPERKPAGEDDAPEPPAPGGALRRGARVEFDGRLIQGQTAKSGAIYLFARKQSKLRSMVEERANYRKELLRTVYPKHKGGTSKE